MDSKELKRMMQSCSAVGGDFTTFLSPSVKKLLVDWRAEHLTYSSSISRQSSFITPNLTFDWNNIESVLESPGRYHDDKGKYYLDVCKQLWPVFIESGCKLQASTIIPNHLWQWTSCQSEVELCLVQLRTEDDLITPLKASLILSSIFENAVGNVYQLEKPTVPFLLRDLLASCELLKIFGKIPMLLAQALLGTPLAFNVRNVCWHGFPAPEEIHFDIAAALVVLITSFGEILYNLKIFSISSRPKMDAATWMHLLPHLESAGFPNLVEHHDEVVEVLQNSKVISITHHHYWKSSFYYLCSGQYGHCLMLLLPALEHLLRCLFCSVNCCLNRILVAEQHTLYTTMDEILNKFFTRSDGVEEENQLLSLLGSKIVEMLMDIFNSFGGPRLRDKLSHGECDIGQIPSEMANHMFCVALLVLLKIDARSQLELSRQLKVIEDNYKAKFHSISLLKSQIGVLTGKVSKLIITAKQDDSEDSKIPDDIVRFQSALFSCLAKFHHFRNDDVAQQIDALLAKPVDTLYRSKADLSMVATLRKITSALEETCENAYDALETQRDSFSQHALRSRQRVSYSRMLEIIPSLENVMNCLILIVLIQLNNLPVTLFEFIRIVQQYAENLASLSKKDKNRWVEIREKSTKFCHQCIGFLAQKAA